ncbi:hypothetical protein [Citricoccus alkalitolerans]|uniref:Uncharacterized protein n=1 Tax=Citricoccus alkalitolerans TaxID=246603 RepID=A0ABV8Y1C5_9MICC
MAINYNACFGDAEYMASISDPTRRGLIGPVGWFSDIFIGKGTTADVDGVVRGADAVLDTVPIPVSEDWEPDVYTAALKRAGWEPLNSLPDRPVRQFPVRSAESAAVDDGDADVALA